MSNNTKKRLIISTGCYSTINAAAIIQSDNSNYKNFLFITSRNYSKSFIKTNKMLTDKLAIFKELRFFKDIKYFDDYFNFFDEIFVPHYLEDAMKIVNINSKAKLYWYDEGMASYAPIDDNAHSKIEKKLSYIYNVEYLGKIKSFLFPSVERKVINKNNLLNIIQKSSELIEEDIRPYKKDKTIILLSQYFSGINKILSEEQEVKLYTQISLDLIQKGYTVLYKEHPRTLNSFFMQVSNNLNNDERFVELKFKSNYPLEFYIKQINPLGIISVFSTSNFSVPHLFNIPSFTFGTEFFIDTIQPKNHHECFSAYTAELYNPSINSLPDISEKTDQESKEKLIEVFNSHLASLNDTFNNSLLVFKHISAYNYIGTQKEFTLCKKLSAEDLDSAIFTKEDKLFLHKIKNQNFFTYKTQKIFNLHTDMIKAFYRLTKNPDSFYLKLLLAELWLKMNLPLNNKKTILKTKINLSKYKNKKVILYGAGVFFEQLAKDNDFSLINVIGICDRSFETTTTKEFAGYKVIKPSELTNQKCDYILVSTLNSINIIKHLESVVNKNIKIEPLVEKSFFALLDELS